MLLIIVLVFSVAIVLSNPDVYQLSLFRILVPVTSAGVFFTGFGAALMTITALLLLRTGIRRSRETRRRLREAEQSAITSTAGTSSAGPDAAGPADRDPDRGDLDRLDLDRDESGDRDAPDHVASPVTGRASEQRPKDPTARPSRSTLNPDPGEATTVPADRRTAERVRDDRDEPRT